MIADLIRVVSRGALIGVTLAAAGCATMRVRSYAEAGANFQQYRTFRVAADTTSTGDPRLDRNPIFQDRVRADVTNVLTARGYEPATSARADMLVHYHASLHQQLELNDTQEERIRCAEAAAAAIGSGSAGADPRPTNCMPYIYEAGTLLIDVVDGRTNRLVWRGWAEGGMDGIADSQAVMEQRVDKTVRQILEKLPPRR